MAYYPGYSPGVGFPYAYAEQLINTAANLGGGTTNPPYSRADFLAAYDQFTGLVPDPMLDQFIALANSIVDADRWGPNWLFGMGLVVAHYATIYLQTTPVSGANAAQVVSAGRPTGIATSKSVDGLSVSYDLSYSGAGMKGWDVWKSTMFGTQFAGLARLVAGRTSYIY
jgi:hypothetical protein